MALVKVCGITRIEDAMEAHALGYNAIGLVFAESPRRISPEQARSISRSLPTGILKVGVFVNEEAGEVKRLMNYCDLDLVQLHGEEDPGEVSLFGARAIKALRPRCREDLELMDEYPDVFAILLDGWNPDQRGGSGTSCDWDLAARAAGSRRVILAGGLNTDNVEEAVARTRPFGVDVSSGVESGPGVKEATLLRDFISRATKALSSAEQGDDYDAST
jgi:phosphoribosylanthranilate isomerase